MALCFSSFDVIFISSRVSVCCRTFRCVPLLSLSHGCLYTHLFDGYADSFADGEAVVYDQANEIIHVLNTTAAIVFKTVIESNENPFKIFADKVWSEDSDVPESVLEKDFQEILNSFINAELIKDQWPYLTNYPAFNLLLSQAHSAVLKDLTVFLLSLMGCLKD